MATTRSHTKLMESYARDLDRRVRSQFIGLENRPSYARHFQQDLLHLLGVSHHGIEIGGRLNWLKRLVQRILRPYSFHHDRVTRLVVERLAELHAEVTELARQIQEQAKSSRAEIDDQIRDLREELRTQHSRPIVHLAPSSDFKLSEGARVALGRLPVRREGFVHVDTLPAATVDHVGRLDALPAAAGSLREIAVANVLEHYSFAEARDRLVPHWRSLLAPGGRLEIVADDAGAMIDRLRAGQLEEAEFLETVFSSNGHGPRRSAYSPDSLVDLLNRAGFINVAIRDRRQRPDAGAFGFEVEGFCPVDQASLPPDRAGVNGHD